MEYCGPVQDAVVVVDVTLPACPKVVASVAARKAPEDIAVGTPSSPPVLVCPAN